ncbi:hypothetical protein METH_13715 [Leisingera methylohalidivorans DSM 14336]|uniref:Uncharacterized protein n=1 Tax=Leisingera methylohalidivorans DSM 14336 TaxID=999552 RepID=V9VWI9_9RHOB|nr:hypothetical protein METH_13715 [Leisingera methylohalidivorans DSM 14336]
MGLGGALPPVPGALACALTVGPGAAGTARPRLPDMLRKRARAVQPPCQRLALDMVQNRFRSANAL